MARVVPMTGGVMVTGANSGIGAATVHHLLARGADVIATVRSDDARSELLGQLDRRGSDRTRLVLDHLDVTDASACAQLVERHRPGVVVNNAGSALLGAVLDVDDDAARDQLEALVLGPVRLARLAVAEGSCRRIVQVGSMVSDGMVPFTGWYAAAKAALEALSEVWRLELQVHGVSVVVVECGAVGTDVWEQAGERVAASGDPATQAGRETWARRVRQLEPLFTDPDEVGEVIAAAALDDPPPSRVRVGFASTLPRWARVVPTPVRRWVTSHVLGLHRTGDGSAAPEPSGAR